MSNNVPALSFVQNGSGSAGAEETSDKVTVPGHPHTPVVLERLVEHLLGLLTITGPVALDEHLAVPAAGVGLLRSVGELGGLAERGAEVLFCGVEALVGHGCDPCGPLAQARVVIGRAHRPGTHEDVHYRWIELGCSLALAEDDQAVHRRHKDSGRTPGLRLPGSWDDPSVEEFQRSRPLALIGQAFKKQRGVPPAPAEKARVSRSHPA